MKSILATAAIFSLTALQSLAYSDSKSGCNAPIPDDAKPGKSVNLKLPSSSGVSPREYRLHLPTGYDGTEKLPLILSFHGRTRSAKSQEELSHFNETYGFKGISVYPQGVPLVNEVRYRNSIFTADANNVLRRRLAQRHHNGKATQMRQPILAM